MNRKKNNTQKRLYICPQINQIRLDNEISLALESTPPEGPDELGLITPEHFNTNPFEKTMG
jgi:hypothetical protein